MNLSIKYNYEICYLPTLRHKKERKACMEDVMEVIIPELSEEEFPLAFEVTEMESVYPGAKNYQDFIENRETSEYCLFTQRIRNYQGKLYKEVFCTFGARISTSHTIPEEYIREDIRRWTYENVPVQDFPYEEGISVVTMSGKNDKEKSILREAEKYKVFNGILWKLCSEPCYEANYSIDGVYVNVIYSSTERLGPFQYSVCDREKLMDDIEVYQAKYNISKQAIHFSCGIKMFGNAEIQHYRPRILKVSIFCQAKYNTSIELPKDFTGGLEDAMDYADNLLDNIPLGELAYVPGNNELDRNGCYLL